MNESFSDQESGRRFVVVSAAVAICLLGTLLYLSTSSRRLKNRNAPSGAQTGVLRAAADAPANFPASAAELAPAANTISRHSSPTNRAQGNPRQPVIALGTVGGAAMPRDCVRRRCQLCCAGREVRRSISRGAQNSGLCSGWRVAILQTSAGS